MIYKRFGDKLVIRLKKGDKLVESVKNILEKENVKAGFLTGIGATDNLDLGLFDPKTKDYKIKKCLSKFLKRHFKKPLVSFKWLFDGRNLFKDFYELNSKSLFSKLSI
ncbi:MAG: DUF296 domain-containing protein [Anaerococcus hydrogenalis]|nr:DUF296 domain-containing protein [Anaerococcus hydrogenalis]